MTVRDTDKGFRALLRRMGAARRGPTLLVGILGEDAAEEHASGAATVGEIAAFHELGLGVPERSWLRGWFEANRSSIQADLRRAAEAIVAGRTTKENALEVLGVKYVGEIQARIAANGVTPNIDPEGPTAKRKGSTVTLIDTGQLRSAVSYVLAAEAGALEGSIRVASASMERT